MGFFLDVLADSMKDTLELVPFLFLTYLAMEALEHGMGDRTERIVSRAGKLGPLVGGVLGALPQCGFSAMGATLYAGRVISVGTVIAVILATSDEMVPVFLAHQEPLGRMMAIIGIKVLVGVVVGFAVDAVLAMRRKGAPAVDEAAREEALESVVHDHHEHVHEVNHGHGANMGHIARSALSHTVEVTLFIFLVSFAFGLAMEAVGQDAVAALMATHPVRATLVSALVGLIPNCAASVMIAELFLAGALPSGAMVAGLLVSGGVGLLVLFRTNESLRQNLAITGFVYVAGVAVGLLVGALGILL